MQKQNTKAKTHTTPPPSSPNKMFKTFEGRETPTDSSLQSPFYPSSSSSLSPSPSPSGPSVTGPARPIRLVYCDEKGRFRMDPEAVATLQLVKGLIGIVSVCGRDRQVKSIILNQLLGRSSGFQVASTHPLCTKGLWLWSASLKRTALDGTEYTLLLLDSEGTDAYDQTGTYSTQIFSLAVLLSSMFIYNQIGAIDEAALDRLSLVTQMTKHIHVKASGGKSSASELEQFSPIFVWLLRDFSVDLVEDNRRVTPPEYLELALRPVEGSGKDIATKNEIRDSIQALFPDRECFTLKLPLNNENDVQRLDQISLDKLLPEFRTGLDALTKFVFERTRPKQVGGTVMTGPILVGIIHSYLEALNNGAVPTISSSWKSNAFMEADWRCSNAIQNVEKRLRAACHASDANVDSNVKVCSECRTSKDLWICVICGFVGCGRYEATHAIEHWERTSHCYSLEFETQRVWNYAHGDYVHQLIQSNRTSGCEDFGCADYEVSVACFNRKLEAVMFSVFHFLKFFSCYLQKSYLNLLQIVHDYNELLDTQLKEQRLCLETWLQEVEKDTEREMSEVFKELQRSQLELNKCVREKKHLDDLNEFLDRDIKTWQLKIREAEEKEAEALRVKDGEINDLEIQVKALMLRLDDIV